MDGDDFHRISFFVHRIDDHYVNEYKGRTVHSEPFAHIEFVVKLQVKLSNVMELKLVAMIQRNKLFQLQKLITNLIEFLIIELLLGERGKKLPIRIRVRI